MGSKSLDRDAVNKNTHPAEQISREQENKMMPFHVDLELQDRLKVFTESFDLKGLQLCRYTLARKMDNK